MSLISIEVLLSAEQEARWCITWRPNNSLNRGGSFAVTSRTTAINMRKTTPDKRIQRSARSEFLIVAPVPFARPVIPDVRRLPQREV